jgi:hypothetical protein
VEDFPEEDGGEGLEVGVGGRGLVIPALEKGDGHEGQVIVCYRPKTIYPLVAVVDVAKCPVQHDCSMVNRKNKNKVDLCGQGD